MREGPRRGVVQLSLAAVVLLAAAVCALHVVNALTLRGTARVSDYAPLARTGETLSLSDEELPLLANGNLRFAPQVETAALESGMLRVSGLLLRPGQVVGEVRVRVGLVPAERPEEIVLLNTQMVRRGLTGQEPGMDDHCGFAASAARRLLPDGQYAVVLADESDGVRRLIDAGVDIALSRDGLTVVRGDGAEEAGELSGSRMSACAARSSCCACCSCSWSCT